MTDDDELVIGFDILPFHSPRARARPKYACAVVRKGMVLAEHSAITRAALLRLVNEIQPHYLATDNIFEIAPSAKTLFRLVERLPVETKVVQVTGVPPHQTSLKRLAKKYGLPLRGKPSPLETARAVALLASMGVGYVLECFGEHTEIKITRGRKPGRGGQSANRYRRNVQSKIQQMTRLIEEQLTTAGIEYEIDIRTSDFGYSSARITAYASYLVVRGLIDSRRGGDFNVLVAPVRKRVEFLPLQPVPGPFVVHPKYFILGVDPGTTAALCLLSLEGQVHLLVSGKGFTRAQIIRTVYEHGVPVLVATDVHKKPHFVKKIASVINADLFIPSRPVSIAEKNEIARTCSGGVRVSNAHERDALAAAVLAYRSIRPKLEQVDQRVRAEHLTVDRGLLKALVIRGTPIAEAIASLTVSEAAPADMPSETPPTEEAITPERYKTLQTKYAELLEENRALTSRVEDLEHLIEFLRFRESELMHSLEIVSRENYWHVKRDREVVKKEAEIRALRREMKRQKMIARELEARLEQLRGVKRREMRGDTLAIRVIPKFTQESIQEYAQQYGLKRADIVLFDDASGGGFQTARLLFEYGIRAVIADTPLSHLAEEELVRSGIPVIDANEVELERVDEFAFISRKKFEQRFQVFLSRIREAALEKGEEELIALIEEYRHDAGR